MRQATSNGNGAGQANALNPKITASSQLLTCFGESYFFLAMVMGSEVRDINAVIEVQFDAGARQS